jgi:uncharacterized protein (TIGR02118 family)
MLFMRASMLAKGTCMIRLMVLYGHPKDRGEFDRYYNDVHVPIAKKMKGLMRWTVGRVTGTPDGSPAPYYYFADLFAESREAMEKVLASPEGQAAVKDVPNFATGGVTWVYTDVEPLV